MPSSVTPQPTRIILHLDLGPEADAEELDHVTRQLRRELRDLDLESVEPVKAGDLPEGAKAGDVVTLGALAIAVLPTVLPSLVSFLQAWTLRAPDRRLTLKTQRGDRSVEVEYDPSMMTAAELTQLVKMLNDTMGDDAKPS